MKTPNGLKGIISTFGELTNDFESKNIFAFDLPYPLIYGVNQVFRARCHRLLIPIFQSVLAEIKANGFENEVKNYSGIYEARNVRGLTHPSTHSWGIAIDLEAEKYPLGSLKRFPQEIVTIFNKHGFFYGGDFKNRRDPMHFQFATGY